MTKHRSHSIEFKRQVAQEIIPGETLHGLAQWHDLSRNLIRIWVAKYEAGAFDEDAGAADPLPQRPAPRLRCPRHRQRRPPQHAQQVDATPAWR